MLVILIFDTCKAYISDSVVVSLYFWIRYWQNIKYLIKIKYYNIYNNII